MSSHIEQEYPDRQRFQSLAMNEPLFVHIRNFRRISRLVGGSVGRLHGQLVSLTVSGRLIALCLPVSVTAFLSLSHFPSIDLSISVCVSLSTLRI